VYSTKDMHSMSLQIQDRRGLKDYIPPSSEVSDNSIIALGKEIPAVINDNELNINKKPENDNQMKMDEMVKYVAVNRIYHLDVNEDRFVSNKRYGRKK
jgi:hypothetical protein